MLIIPATGFMMESNLELQMFSLVDRDRFSIEFELTPQASITQTEAKNKVLFNTKIQAKVLFP